MLSERGMSITALGMASALGAAAEACAAHRTALIRVKELNQSFAVASGGDVEPQVACVCDPAASFDGYARLAYLLYLAFADLINAVETLPEPTTTALVVALPATDERPFLKQMEYSLECEGDALFREMLLALCPFLSKLRQIVFLRGGHAAGYEAIRHARGLLQPGLCEACYVAAVDSCLDDASLERLHATGRLKTPARAVGLVPGEGAAVLLVGHDGVVAPLATVEDYTGKGASAQAQVTSLFRQMMSALGDAPDRIHYLVADINGENWRARHLATLLVRLRAKYGQRQAPEVWPIAGSFADVGAATALFQVCVATRALQGGYAGASHVLTYALSVSQDCGCALVGAVADLTSPEV